MAGSLDLMMMTLVRICGAAASPAKDSRDWLDACKMPDLARAKPFSRSKGHAPSSGTARINPRAF